MIKTATQFDCRTATTTSPAVDTWQRFFFFTADSERVPT
jgi:hypothetical protein